MRKMNQKGEVGIGSIILMFVGIIVIVGAFIPAIFNTQNEMTDKQVVADEAIDISTARIPDGSVNNSVDFTVTNNPTGWKTTLCPLTGVVYGNSSEDYTLTTDYTVNLTSGVLNVVNTTTTVDGGNDTVIDYNWCMDGYNTNSGSRGVARIIGLFSVFALLAYVLYYLKFEY